MDIEIKLRGTMNQSKILELSYNDADTEDEPEVCIGMPKDECMEHIYVSFRQLKKAIDAIEKIILPSESQ